MQRRFETNDSVLKDCKIYQMLQENAEKQHLSFHTPGHKVGAWDITELSFSDNLACPRGCILQAETDIARILGAEKSFLLTDGSTCGVLSMLYVAKSVGVRKIAVCRSTHKSFYNGCSLLGLTPLTYAPYEDEKIPFPPTMSVLKSDFAEILEQADALFLTSPDYYGNVADLRNIREYCDQTGKLLLIDGAHGGHLHFDKKLYAGGYADLWVDGVHKSLPALTQGAVVSAKNAVLAEKLQEAVGIFRTTSPSYPIMASVEYAVKYPRNNELEIAVKAYAKTSPRLLLKEDWTKLCAVFGGDAFAVEEELQARGIYPEFCDGNVIMFYLSPATKKEEFDGLRVALNELFIKYPLHGSKIKEKGFQSAPVPFVLDKNANTEWVEMENAVGEICAADCGLFPPCTPLIARGERITEEKINLLHKAGNVFGLSDGKILTVKTPKSEE
ncbi:MAG: aminotransferase class I/II-fold pyridoxal phosphate-dependent enzyme [Clostridiales bacterium]|nr:aminotransferase class I/II-fold pyridoxal phosphate-dependent enzyme [Clostridiales bacterium]